MGGTYSTYGGEERCVQQFDEEPLMERDHLEDPGVDGMITLTFWSRNFTFKF